MADLRKYSQLMLLAAVEKYGPCDADALFADVCHEMGLTADRWREAELWIILVELLNAGLVEAAPPLTVTDTGRAVLAAAARPVGVASG